MSRQSVILFSGKLCIISVVSVTLECELFSFLFFTQTGEFHLLFLKILHFSKLFQGPFKKKYSSQFFCPNK